MWVLRSIKYNLYEIEDRLKRLRLRNWINSNPKIVISISIATAALFLLIVTLSLISNNSPTILRSQKAWFYDLNTQKLFVADDDRIPPIDAPSGKLADGQPAGVRAYVFSYVDDPKEAERFIGYLEKFTPEGQKMISTIRKSKCNVTRNMVRQLNRNRLIRRVPDTDWFPANSEDGQFILKQVTLANQSGKIPRDYLPR